MKRFRGSPDDWLKWLVGDDDALARGARLALGGITPADDVSPEPLIAALGDHNEKVVFWAATALGRLESHATAAIPALLTVAAAHEDLGARQMAIHALSRIAAADSRVKSALLRALQDDSPSVRREALQALISVPELGSSDLKKIEAMSGDKDEAVARWSEVALRNIRLRRSR